MRQQDFAGKATGLDLLMRIAFCVLVQMLLSRKYSICLQTICRVTKEFFEK